MSLALASRRAAISPAWVKNPLWRTARAVPSLDLPFADTKSLADAVTGQSLVTFTRASSGTSVGSDGVLRTAAVNEPRFDHNPTTGESLGLLVEEQRTNSIRNNTMVGAVAGAPGTLPTNWSLASLPAGLSREVVGSGTISGIDYIDIRISGTPTATGTTQVFFEPNNGVSALQNQTWTTSVWLSIASGTQTNITNTALGHTERNSSLTAVASGTTAAVSLSSTLTRFTATRTLTDATTAYFQTSLRITVSNTVDPINITLRIGLPQLEQGAFATSVIPTTGTAATRSADVASITGTNFSSWYRQDEGTNLIEFRETDRTGTRTPRSLSDGTVSNRIDAFLSSSLTVNNRLVLAGVSYNPGNLTLLAAGTVNKHVFSAAPSSAIAVINGTLSTESAPPSLPVVNRIFIGADSVGGTPFTGTIRRLTYWPQRLPNSTLQAITQ